MPRPSFPARHRAAHLLAPALFALIALAPPSDAGAAWPPPPGATPDQLKLPANWPNDPGYGPRRGGKPDFEGEGGLWQYWSWMPPHSADHPVRKGETATGMSVDVAWTYTIGDARVRIAVLDSGIEWDNRDLVHTAALNAKELAIAKPLDVDGKPCGGEGELAGYDCNKDGVFNLYDYEVSKKTSAGVDFHDANANGILDPGDLIVLFSNGKDEDGNGFVDDISGWDFFKNDNDPYDDTRYGHGTGEARDSAAEGNNGIDSIGVCPKCQFIPLRVGDSFIADSQDFAKAVVYGVDNGAKVIQEALGTVNQTTVSRAAIDYAYKKGTVVIASAADENSRHHNMPGAANHTVVVHAIQRDTDSTKSASTYLTFHPCSNYGGQAVLSASGTGCASEATGRSSGVAGLIYAMGLKSGKELNAEEVRQLMMTTADLIDVPESYDKNHPDFDPKRYYPSKPTFSQRFGYGRVNTGSAVGAVAQGKIPPEVDLEKPEWFEILYPSKWQTQDVPLKGHVSARFANTYDAVVEWAPGVEPDERDWKQISQIPAQPGAKPLGVDGVPLAYLKVKDLGKIENAGEPENRYTITVRIRATAHYPAPVGDVKGETRKTFYIYDDPTLVAGFPKYLGTSGEASPRLVDLDGDGKREILYPTSDGALHAFRADGTELPGWPFRTRRIDGLQPVGKEESPFVANYLGGKNAWTDGSLDPDSARETIMSAPAIGDIDGDGKPEIVFGTWPGTLYALRFDGKPVGGRWPIRLPDVPSCPRGEQKKLPEAGGTECMDQTHHLARGAFAGTVLVDMDKDGVLDVVSADFDGKVRVFNGKGDPLPGFPVTVHYSGTLRGNERYSRIVTTPAVGDLNGDGIPEIAVGSNQYLGTGGGLGAFFVVDGRGNKAPDGPYLKGWPFITTSFKLFPLVGEGIVSAGMMADVDNDGVPEVIFHGTGSTPFVLTANPEPPSVQGGYSPNSPLRLDPNFGDYTNSQLGGNNFIAVFSAPSVGDMDQDGKPDIVAYGASFFLALALQSSQRQPYEQLAAMWSGAAKPCRNDKVEIPGTRCGYMFAGSPTQIEDYTFFHNGTIADVSGDGYPETIVGTGGYYIHAVDACGREASGFPKFTGQWVIPSATVGDLDGDKKLEVVSGTRDGWLYAWKTEGREDGAVEWPTYHHDNQNTGNYATKLDFPAKKAHVPPLDFKTCNKVATPPTPGGPKDPATPGTPELKGGGGCGCVVAGRAKDSSSTSAYDSWRLAALGAAAALVARRRRRRVGWDCDDPRTRDARRTDHDDPGSWGHLRWRTPAPVVIDWRHCPAPIVSDVATTQTTTMKAISPAGR